jgi:hypothetical protein
MLMEHAAMKTLAATLILLAALALAACGWRVPADLRPTPDKQGPSAEPSPVVIKTDRDVYRAGETIIGTIENNTTNAIRFMAVCSPQLCQKSGEDWVCVERECDGQVTVLEPRNRAAFILQARRLVLDRTRTDASLRYKLDYQVVSEEPYFFAYSDEFTLSAERTDCEEARQTALDYARASADWDSIDVGRVTVRWRDDDRACVVDFAWQDAEQIQPGLWTSGYEVVIDARPDRVADAYAYER